MRITTVRIIVQTIVMALFLTFVFLTTMTHLDSVPALKFWVSKFLEIDPLVGIATALTTHTVYKGLIWSLVLLVPTLLLGRIFCNWICPYGILHQFTGWLFNRREAKEKIDSNRYRKLFAVKYYILAAMIVAAVCSSLQIGLLDPICLLHRSITTAILPALNMPAEGIFGDSKHHLLAWVIGFLLLFLVGMNLIIPRFFCRVLCPLGATLGILSRFAIWRIERDPVKCTDCDLCLQSCEGACDPHTHLRKSECFVCFNCIEDCPHDALKFAFLPTAKHEVPWPEVPVRRALLAGAIGLAFYPFAKLAARTTKDFSTKVVRPPGSVEEREFLERCIKCDQCIRVCPTNVLQPAMFEAGAEGVWTPIMNFRVGFCQLNCTACGQVCPTGAIQRLSVEEKLGVGPYTAQGPVRLGTAHYDFGRCLPWSKNIPCVVCEEVCPTSPKAIHSEYRQMPVRDGKKLVRAAGPTSLTLTEYSSLGMAGESCLFRPGEYKGDQTTSYHVRVIHKDGTSETHRILGNDADTLLIGEADAAGELIGGTAFARVPEPGSIVEINLEFKVPKIDTALCIGCGMCEVECPVVGDRRAVYVTPEGETRSQNYNQRDRNRSLRLIKTASADHQADGAASGSLMSLSTMIASVKPKRGGSGCSSGRSSAGGCGQGCGCGSGGKAAPGAPSCSDGHRVDLRRFLS